MEEEKMGKPTPRRRLLTYAAPLGAGALLNTFNPLAKAQKISSQNSIEATINREQKAAIESIMNEVRLNRAMQSSVAGELTMRRGNLSTRADPSASTNTSGNMLLNHTYLQKFTPLLKAIFNGDKPPPSPPPVPTTLGPFDTGYIAFPDGIPVGGSSSLTLDSDGKFDFHGSFHVSGLPSYNFQLAWVIVDNATGTAFTFSHQGHLAGTFESGSRDNSWPDSDPNGSGPNATIAANWTTLVNGYTWRWQAQVNWDVAALIDSIVKVITAAGTVINTVVAVV